jgi:hypothetical protein
MSFNVRSEVGRLRQVIVHRPGLELSRLTLCRAKTGSRSVGWGFRSSGCSPGIADQAADSSCARLIRAVISTG